MREQDTEIERLKECVSCAALLEQLAPGWRLDRAESTRRSPKYRRGPGEILIVSHCGLFYWWPVWRVGFIMGILSLFSGHLLATVPTGTTAKFEGATVEVEGTCANCAAVDQRSGPSRSIASR